jgi:hypothetical protein
MNEDSTIQYITGTFDDVQTLTASGNTFIFYGPEQKFPFATLMTNDDNDQFSNLNRPSIFRLNIGISKATYQSLFGPQPARPAADGEVEPEHDFTALDQLMPHPVYGRMYWVCILNPSEATFQTVVQPLLAEAYKLDVARHTKKATRQ